VVVLAAGEEVDDIGIVVVELVEVVVTSVTTVEVLTVVDVIVGVDVELDVPAVVVEGRSDAPTNAIAFMVKSLLSETTRLESAAKPVHSPQFQEKSDID
jgi:hypothetical protein